MTVREIVRILNAKVIVEAGGLDMDINSACGSDLMSDVMAFAKENILLLTGLVNPQVVRTAEMMDIRVIAFVRGKIPGENVTALAREMGITILTTEYPMFIACGKLYSAGIMGRGA